MVFAVQPGYPNLGTSTSIFCRQIFEMIESIPLYNIKRNLPIYKIKKKIIIILMSSDNTLHKFPREMAYDFRRVRIVIIFIEKYSTKLFYS